jgi:hypothetical protein
MRKAAVVFAGLLTMCLVTTAGRAQFVPVFRPAPTVPTVPVSVGGAYGGGSTSPLGGIHSIQPIGGSLPQLSPAPQVAPGLDANSYHVNSASTGVGASTSSPTDGGYTTASQAPPDAVQGTLQTHDFPYPAAAVGTIPDVDVKESYTAGKVVQTGPPANDGEGDGDGEDDDGEARPWWVWLLVAVAAVVIVAKLRD